MYQIWKIEIFASLDDKSVLNLRAIAMWRATICACWSNRPYYLLSVIWWLQFSCFHQNVFPKITLLVVYIPLPGTIQLPGQCSDHSSRPPMLWQLWQLFSEEASRYNTWPPLEGATSGYTDCDSRLVLPELNLQWSAPHTIQKVALQ